MPFPFKKKVIKDNKRGKNMVDKTKKNKKLSKVFQEIGANEEKYFELHLLLEDAIVDDDTPQWKRKLAKAVYKEIQ